MPSHLLELHAGVPDAHLELEEFEFFVVEGLEGVHLAAFGVHAHVAAEGMFAHPPSPWIPANAMLLTLP
ncbi:hypothetical protein, partial [Klebsiella aerogenes]|uniref:hypothetical protein n=1 Tax=Klebsiella aerogenes TaxID=548 RepID=UPI0013D227C0